MASKRAGVQLRRYQSPQYTSPKEILAETPRSDEGGDGDKLGAVDSGARAAVGAGGAAGAKKERSGAILKKAARIPLGEAGGPLMSVDGQCRPAFANDAKDAKLDSRSMRVTRTLGFRAK